MHAVGGLKLIDLVALSPTTLFSGTVRVILSPSSEQTVRIWAAFRCVFQGNCVFILQSDTYFLFRLFLTTLPWLGGLLPFGNNLQITI